MRFLVAKKQLTPKAKRTAVALVTERFGLSLRRACRLVRLWRSAQQYRPRPRPDEASLRQRLRELAEQRRRFGAPRLHDPGKPTQNGYVESFNGRLRDECLNE